MAGCPAHALAVGHWTTYAHGAPEIAAFIVFGPIGEELLFRGVIFERARKLSIASATPALIVSTAAFSLHHIALGTAPAGLALTQILFTIPMGLVLAVLRERTGRLWPGLLVHIATNLPAIF